MGPLLRPLARFIEVCGASTPPQVHVGGGMSCASGGPGSPKVEAAASASTADGSNDESRPGIDISSLNKHEFSITSKSKRKRWWVLFALELLVAFLVLSFSFTSTMFRLSAYSLVVSIAHRHNTSDRRNNKGRPSTDS